VLYNATVEHDETIISQAYRALTKPVRHEALYQAINELIASPDGVPEYSNRGHHPDVLSYKPSVLVVDDNAANLKLAEALFLEIGANVTCATSGQQALELLSKSPFDAVFMDIQMPEMDGVETTQIIRSRPSAYRDIPVVALTAYAMEKEKEQWLTCGFDDYLTKPVTESQLLEALLRWTDVRVQAPSSQQASRTTNLVDPDTLGDVVDIELGIRLAGGKPDLAKELFELLVENLGKDANAIKSAAGLPNNNNLFQHVHYLLGATRYCGVPALQQATERLEISIKKNDASDFDPALAAFLIEINRVQIWAKNNQWASPQPGQ
jgi:two-component system sensor histidine kinase BarA